MKDSEAPESDKVKKLTFVLFSMEDARKTLCRTSPTLSQLACNISLKLCLHDGLVSSTNEVDIDNRRSGTLNANHL